MQNHGGYDAGTVPDEDLTHYAPAGLDDDTCARMNVYLTCIEKSDQELSAFMEQLRELDRPVVLVFFGDHQPTVSTAMNDELYAGENSLEHTARIYSSNYFVWANYDVAGAEQISQRVRSDRRPTYRLSKGLARHAPRCASILRRLLRRHRRPALCSRRRLSLRRRHRSHPPYAVPQLRTKAVSTTAARPSKRRVQ